MAVALRKESVDRNTKWIAEFFTLPESLSARRAWIEISVTRYKPTPKPSLSARRAWIEISTQCKLKLSKCVALRKESVDRNRYQNCE